MLKSFFPFFDIFSEADIFEFSFILDYTNMFYFENLNLKTITADEIIDDLLGNWTFLGDSTTYHGERMYRDTALYKVCDLACRSFFMEYDYFYKLYKNKENINKTLSAYKVKELIKSTIADDDESFIESQSFDTTYSRNLSCFKSIANNDEINIDPYIIKPLVDENFQNGKMCYHAIDAVLCMNIIMRIKKLPTNEKYRTAQYTSEHLKKFMESLIGIDIKDETSRITNDYLLERLFHFNSIYKINNCYNNALKEIDSNPELYFPSNYKVIMSEVEMKMYTDSLLKNLLNVLSDIPLMTGIFNQVQIIEYIYNDFMEHGTKNIKEWTIAWKEIIPTIYCMEKYLMLIHAVISYNNVEITNDMELFKPLFRKNNGHIVPQTDYDTSNFDVTNDIKDKIFFDKKVFKPFSTGQYFDFIDVLKRGMRQSFFSVLKEETQKYVNQFYIY